MPFTPLAKRRSARRRTKPMANGAAGAKKKSPASSSLRMPGKYLATTYSHRTCRPTTIGAAAFHFRVRNGTGWFHRALATRGQPRSIGAGTLAVRHHLANFPPTVIPTAFGHPPLGRSLTSTRRSSIFSTINLPGSCAALRKTAISNGIKPYG